MEYRSTACENVTSPTVRDFLAAIGPQETCGRGGRALQDVEERYSRDAALDGWGLLELSKG